MKKKLRKKMEGIALAIKRNRGEYQGSPNPAEIGRGKDEGEHVPVKPIRKIRA